MFFGVCPPDRQVSITPFDILVRQLKLVGVPSLNRNIPAALEMLSADTPRMRRLISNRVPIDEIPSFLTKVGRPDIMKVQLAA